MLHEPEALIVPSVLGSGSPGSLLLIAVGRVRARIDVEDQRLRGPDRPNDSTKASIRTSITRSRLVPKL